MLDATEPGGARELDRLAAGADVLLWSGRPADLPFDPHELAERHPALVVVVLTPFGLTGRRPTGTRAT